MRQVKRVCAFYSIGPHFELLLRQVHIAYPDAVIDAWMPPGVGAPSELRSVPCNVIQTELAHYSPSNVTACVRLIRQLRERRYDTIVVMFDSVQLLSLAALSRAPLRLLCTPRGRIIPMRSSIGGVVWSWFSANIHGRIMYLKVWLAARCLRVKR